MTYRVVGAPNPANSVHNGRQCSQSPQTANEMVYDTQGGDFTRDVCIVSAARGARGSPGCPRRAPANPG